MIGTMDNGSRMIDAGLDLLDRQLMDKDGLAAGKVDDLELTPPPDGSGPPVLTAILAGPGALAPRLGSIAVAVARRRLRLAGLSDPSRISWGVVSRLGTEVALAVGRDELDSMTSERWAGRLISRIRGAR
jgi:hypothetical protein